MACVDACRVYTFIHLQKGSIFIHLLVRVTVDPEPQEHYVLSRNTP